MGNVKPDERRTPDQFSVKARLECWWWCGSQAHPWFVARPGAHLHSFECPYCREDHLKESHRVSQQLVSEVPELVAAWRDESSYDGLIVQDLFGGVAAMNAGRVYSLRCPENHKLDSVVRSFVFAGCPYCRGQATRRSPRQSIRAADPELAAIFHPTRNAPLTPDSTPGNYGKPLWWKSVQCCGYEWQETITERTLGRRPQAGRGHYYCPRCESEWGSLAWLDPELASEWHPANEISAWHVRPFSGGTVVRWRCSANPEHEWEAAVAERSAGRLCPYCSTAGTSQIERLFLEAAQAIDPEAAPVTLNRWRVDVLMPSRRLVIEYDGEYWHKSKQDTDLRKTRELISMGFQVARIRENDLPHLDLETSRLRQISFRPEVETPENALRGLLAWAEGRP